jgi:hypothetical protein
MPATVTVSVVIPVYNAEPYLAACLECVARLNPAPLECIVADDGSTDGSAEIARRAGFTVLSCGQRRGPAFARNLGAARARGEFLLFLDADVLAPPDVVARVLDRFEEDPARDAVIGSYDSRPADPGFGSQYRNLLHAFTHQHSRPETSTFWTGCGAIRRRVFLEQGGFRETAQWLEDIELGLRLRQAGHPIWLDKGLQVKHLKKFGLLQILKIDLIGRAIPWTRLILRFRSMPADLNLRWEHRVSVLLACLAVPALALSTGLGGGWTALAASAASAGFVAALLATLNRAFYRFLAERRGLWFAARAFPFHYLYFLCCGLGFAAGTLLHLFSRGQAAESHPSPTARLPRGASETEPVSAEPVGSR